MDFLLEVVEQIDDLCGFDLGSSMLDREMIPSVSEGFRKLIERVLRIIRIEIKLIELLHHHKLKHFEHDERRNEVKDDVESLAFDLVQQ